MSKKAKRNCTKGYSCGFTCISVKFACPSQGLKGQAVVLADNYFQLAKAANPQPKPFVAPERGTAIARGAFGETYLRDGKVLKRYFSATDADMQEYEMGAQIGNKFAERGLAPRQLGFFKAEGSVWAEQEFLEGYAPIKDVGAALKDPVNKQKVSEFIDRAQAAMQELNVVHGDLHGGNLMAKIDANNQLVDLKLIDWDFAASQDIYGDPASAWASEALDIATMKRMFG